MAKIMKIEFESGRIISTIKVPNPLDRYPELFYKDVEHYRIDDNIFWWHKLSWLDSKRFFHHKINSMIFPLPLHIMGVDEDTKFNFEMLEKYFEHKIFELFTKAEFKLKYPNYYIFPEERLTLRFVESKEEELDKYKIKKVAE